MRVARWLLLGALVAGCTKDPNDPDVDTSGLVAGPGSTFFGTSSTVACPAPHARTVLVDPSHDGGTWWYPQAASTPAGYRPDSSHQGKALATYLRTQGYTVTELGRNATMSQDSLLTYAVVIRAGYYNDTNNPGYTPSDQAAYRAFTSCPRTLVLLAEYLRDNRSDALADSLGIPLTGIVSGTITTFTSHLITAGVTSVPYIAGSYLANEANAAIQVLGRVSSGQAVMGLLTSRAAKIFFIGDVNGIEQVPQPFVNNLILWGF